MGNTPELSLLPFPSGQKSVTMGFTSHRGDTLTTCKMGVCLKNQRHLKARTVSTDTACSGDLSAGVAGTALLRNSGMSITTKPPTWYCFAETALSWVMQQCHLSKISDLRVFILGTVPSQQSWSFVKSTQAGCSCRWAWTWKSPKRRPLRH